jgi:peptidoglycan/LPS O-acetylase OafA/YrhL
VGAFLQILIALLVAWLAWRLIRKMLRPQAPAEPIEDPSRRLA